jgi:hypothetical protein
MSARRLSRLLGSVLVIAAAFLIGNVAADLDLGSTTAVTTNSYEWGAPRTLGSYEWGRSGELPIEPAPEDLTPELLV